jgi:hypothetical protein
MARLSARWQEAALALRRGVAALNVSPDRPPRHLHHFTDCTGLIGIFEHKQLWASLATSMNDPSEVTFGLKLAHELFVAGTIAARHVDLTQVDLRASQLASESRAYVVSFCANLNLAGQWLHYGRSGSGVAVGFHGDRLEQRPFALFRVLYDRAEQVRLIASVIESVDSIVDEIGTAGRVVPYKKIEYDPLPAFEVVLGASCPMRPDELGIRVLMDEKLRTRLTVSLSAVPVRA